MARRPPPPPPPGRLHWLVSYAKLGAWLVMLAALGGFAWLLYDTYIDQRGTALDDQVPLLRVNPLPVKVEPAERGGLQVPHQDVLVLRSAEGPTEPTGPDQLGPLPEQPLPRPEPVGDSGSEQPFFLPDEGGAEALIMRGGGGYDRPDPPPEVPLPEAAPQVAALAEQGSGSPAAAALAGLPISVLPTPKPPAPDPSVPAVAGTANIQVAAVPTEAEAAGEWTRLSRRFPDQLGDLAYTVEPLTDGQLFRLLAGPLDRRTAVDRCEAIKAQGGDCFVPP